MPPLKAPSCAVPPAPTHDTRSPTIAFVVLSSLPTDARKHQAQASNRPPSSAPLTMPTTFASGRGIPPIRAVAEGYAHHHYRGSATLQQLLNRQQGPPANRPAQPQAQPAAAAQPEPTAATARTARRHNNQPAQRQSTAQPQQHSQHSSRNSEDHAGTANTNGGQPTATTTRKRAPGTTPGEGGLQFPSGPGRAPHAPGQPRWGE